MTDTQTDPKLPKAKSAAALKKAGLFEGVTLPSGIQVDIRLPNFTQMVAAGAIPNELVDTAIQAGARASEEEQAKRKEKTNEERIEEIKKDWEFVKFILPVTLVTPEIKADDVDGLNPADIDLLVALAARITDTDAIGHQLGGLETQSSFRKHRGIVDLDAALERVS